MAVVQELQKKIEPLIKEAQSGGNIQELRPKIMKIREEHVGRIEALLSDAQKKQWKEMLRHHRRGCHPRREGRSRSI